MRYNRISKTVPSTRRVTMTALRVALNSPFLRIYDVLMII